MLTIVALQSASAAEVTFKRLGQCYNSKQLLPFNVQQIAEPSGGRRPSGLFRTLEKLTTALQKPLPIKSGTGPPGLARDRQASLQSCVLQNRTEHAE